MRLGFIGTGKITSALVTGLCTADNSPTSIYLSPRNIDRATSLRNTFDQIVIGHDNQDVIDHCDWVFLAVLPQSAETILSSIKFHKHQKILSLMATISVDSLINLVAPASDIVRVVPLPTAAQHLGPIALCPPDFEIKQLMNEVGNVVEVTEEHDLYALWSVTSLMAPYFELLRTTIEWLIREGVSKDLAHQYALSMFHGLSTLAKETESIQFDPFVKDHQTPGGLNEQVIKSLTQDNWYSLVENILDVIRRRMNGK